MSYDQLKERYKAQILYHEKEINVKSPISPRVFNAG